ncbi:MAG: glycosyltransferase family 2 protein, partial [Waterburya sp.]
MTEPTVSVIIPTYNCDRYIAQAIKSVFQQESCTYEIIVIDDGSTDLTAEVLKPYSERLRYVKQKNQGVAAARNYGI